MRAIVVRRAGGPEVLEAAEVPDPQPGPGQLLVDVAVAGVNFMDIYQREGRPPYAPALPYVPGAEGAGTVVAAGPDVTGFAVGDRVAWTGVPGSYASRAVVPAVSALPVPDGIGLETAGAVLLQGMTAHYLSHDTFPVGNGDTVVVHAAAGGVGTIAVQLAKRWGAGRVIATASTDDKRQLALDLGADVAVDSTTDNLRDALREANGGAGVDIVLEMTGGPVFDQSLIALAPLGRLAVFGMAGRRPPTPIEPASLMAHSTAVIGFWLAHLTRRPELLAAAVTDLLDLLARDEIRAVVGGTYSLDQVPDAHRSLLDRSSAGKLILDPWA